MNPVDIDLPLSIIPDTQPRISKFKQLHTVIEMGAATNYLEELVQIKKTLFLHSMQYLQIVLTVGYYALLIPFRISVDDEGYKLITNPVQWILTCTLLVMSIGFQLLITETMWTATDLTTDPEGSINTYEYALAVMVMMTYIYTFIIKRHRFMNMFERFNSCAVIRRESVNTKKRLTLISCTFLFLLAWANWSCWGHDAYFEGLQFTVGDFYNKGAVYLGPHFCDQKYGTCYYGVGIGTLLLKLHKEIVMVYFELIMWGCALCLYNIEITAKTFLLKDENFDIKKVGIDVFRIINNLIQEFCLAMGPITVAYYLQLIPYAVGLVLSYNRNTYQWHQLVIAVFKLGHILMTAESNANANNLVGNIMANRIAHNPENVGKIMILKSVTTRPIALQGMDFFEVTYRFLGTVGLSVITYCLLVVELSNNANAKISSLTCGVTVTNLKTNVFQSNNTYTLNCTHI